MNEKTNNLPMPDPHFGTDEEMLDWCKDENLIPIKDEEGEWDWNSVWEEYMNRPENKEEDDDEL